LSAYENVGTFHTYVNAYHPGTTIRKAKGLPGANVAYPGPQAGTP
jgi:hypothetical protein